jgi:RHS repeat-associated protein
MINYLISENKLINLFEYPFTRPCGAGKSVENLQKARLELQKNMSQRVVLPDNRVITYQIDARGRRIGKKIDNVFVYGFIYGDQLNPIAKVDESGNIIESYIYGLKSNIPEYLIKDGKKYKIISNHLGSPIMVLGGQAQDLPVLQMKYDSFGNIIEENGSFEIPFGFAGGLYDKDTKLTRFGVRDYDSETGRWTSKEPLGFAGARKFQIQMPIKGYARNQRSCNFYVYAGNDGVNYVDVIGLKKINHSLSRNPEHSRKKIELLKIISPIIEQMIGDLENSGYDINLMSIEDDPNGYDNGICYTPSNEFDNKIDIYSLDNSNKEKSELGVLAHELMHAWQYVMGYTNKYSPKYANYNRMQREINSIQIQNIVRAVEGYELRTTWGPYDLGYQATSYNPLTYIPNPFTKR